MEINYGVFSPEENILYEQIKSYYISQKIIKELISKNIQVELELYIINDKFLNQWKQYSCFEEIKFNLPLKNPLIWRQIRQENNADRIKLENVNNIDLIIFGNVSINNNFTINPKENFHFVTKECFEILSKDKVKDNDIIKFTFISCNYKLISKFGDKIFVIYEYQRSLHLLLFIINNPNDNFFLDIKEKKIDDFLQQNGIERSMDRFQLNNNSIFAIDKSFENNNLKRQQFHNLILSLINFEYNFRLSLESNNLEKKIFYLINEDWIHQFKSKLNYVFWSNQKNIGGIDDKIRGMLNEYIRKIKDNENMETINQTNSIFYYLKDNNTQKIIKYHSNYTFINDKIWKSLIKFFNWNIEISVIAYVTKNNIIIQFDENNMEIIQISNEMINSKLLFCLEHNYKVNEIINEIKNFGINGYYQKYNINNILINNQSYQKLFSCSNENECIGIIININKAINNNNDFIVLNNNEFNNQNLYLGLNDYLILHHSINNNINNIINNNINNEIDNAIQKFINNLINMNNKNSNNNIIGNNNNINPHDKENKNNLSYIPDKLINVVIRFLSSCKTLTNCLLNQSNFNFFEKNSKNLPITYSYARIIKAIFSNNNNNLYNFLLKELINQIERINTSNINKPIELYKLLLEKIHQENKQHFQKKKFKNIIYNDERKKMFGDFYNNIYDKENTTIISNNFSGVIELTSKCEKCNQFNYEYDIFYYIIFPLEEIYKNLANQASNLLKHERNKSFLNIIYNAHNKIISLNICFDYYLNLDKRQNLFCNKCKSHNNNSYNHKLIILPKVLCIVLINNCDLKIIADFSEILDISKYLEDFVRKKKYNLIGIITYLKENNIYNSINKNIFDNQWYLYDGNQVTKFNNLPNQNIGIPYMLLYQEEN